MSKQHSTQNQPSTGTRATRIGGQSASLAPQSARLLGHAAPADLLALQRTLGNRAVGRLLAGTRPLQRVLEPDDSWGSAPWRFNSYRQLWEDINTAFNRIPALRVQLQANQSPAYDGSADLQRLDSILGALHTKYDPVGVKISRERAEVLLPILQQHNANADNLIAGVPNQRQLQLQQEQQTLGQLRQRLGGPLEGLGFVPAAENIDDTVRTNLRQQLLQRIQANQLLGQQAVAQLTQTTVQIEQQYQQTALAVQRRNLQRDQLAEIDECTELSDTLEAVINRLAPTAYAVTDRRALLQAQVQQLLPLRGQVEQNPLAAVAFQQALQPRQAALQQLQTDVQQDVRNNLGPAVTGLRATLQGLNQHLLSQAENLVRAARRTALQNVLQAAQQFTVLHYDRIPDILNALAQGQAFVVQANQRIAELQDVAVAPAVQDQIGDVSAGDLFEGLHAPAAISAVTAFIQPRQAQVEELLAMYEPALIRQMAADNAVAAKWFNILPTLHQQDWNGAPDVEVDLAGHIGEVPVEVEWNHILQVHVNRYATPVGVQDHSFNPNTSFWRDSNATIDDIGAAIKACIENAALQGNVHNRVQNNAHHRIAAVTINGYRIGVTIEEGQGQGRVTVGQFYDTTAADLFNEAESVQLSMYMALKR